MVVKVRNKQYKVNIDNPVLNFDMSAAGTINTKSIVPINEKLIPVGAETGTKFSEWWNERAIPETRCPRVQLLSFFII